MIRFYQIPPTGSGNGGGGVRHRRAGLDALNKYSQASLTGQLNYSMLVTHALAVRPAALPVVTVGDTFSKQLKASGGSGSGYTFSAPRLPGWLTWDCHRAVRPAR